MIKKIKTKIKTARQNGKLKKAQKKEQKEQLYAAATAFDDAVCSWQTSEFVRHDRGIIWKIMMPLLVFLAVFMGIYYDVWTFSLAIATFALVYYILHRKGPETINVVISDIGIKVGSRCYPFSKIKAFWIIYQPPVLKTLHIRVSGDIALNIAIELEDQHPAAIRELLIDKIPEIEGQKVSLVESLARLLKL